MVRAADATASKDEEEESKVGVYGGPTRLKEGLRRQTMLIYVADETGMINRVAGVFARRGYNIESLAVGLNVDKAIFTVVVIATDSDVDKLIKQINKLAKVRRVELVTDKMCVERGLMLIKVRAEPEQRPEIIERKGVPRLRRRHLLALPHLRHHRRSGKEPRVPAGVPQVRHRAGGAHG